MIDQLTELTIFGIALAALANLIVLPVLIIWKLIRLERVVARMSGDLEGLVWEHESDDPPPGEDMPEPASISSLRHLTGAPPNWVKAA
jgi:predicted RND superfamily exporter protein